MTGHPRARLLAPAFTYLGVLQQILEREPSCAAALDRVRALHAALQGETDPTLASDHARGIRATLDHIAARELTGDGFDAVVRRTLDVDGTFADAVREASRIVSLLGAELEQLDARVHATDELPAPLEAPGWLSHWLVQFTVRVLPPESRARWYEEYLADFRDLRGPRRQVPHAGRMLASAWSMRRSLTRSESRKPWATGVDGP